MTMKKPKLMSRVIDGTLMYRDELASKESWIPYSGVSSYIKKFYMMSTKEYFDRVMEIRHETNSGKCLICGNPTKWSNIHEGYKDTCSVYCRNKLQSLGNDRLLIITKTGLITHSTNSEYVSKYIIDPTKKSEITEGSIEDTIDSVVKLGGVWVSGYTPKSIKYAPKEIKSITTRKSTLW